MEPTLNSSRRNHAGGRDGASSADVGALKLSTTSQSGGALYEAGRRTVCGGGGLRLGGAPQSIVTRLFIPWAGSWQRDGNQSRQSQTPLARYKEASGQTSALGRSADPTPAADSDTQPTPSGPRSARSAGPQLCRQGAAGAISDARPGAEPRQTACFRRRPGPVCVCAARAELEISLG